MIHQVSRKRLKWVGLALLIIAVLFAVAVVAYAFELRAAATSLVRSASAIHTSADAEREIKAWRSRSRSKFWEESSTSSNDQTYGVHVDNLLLSRLRLIEPTDLKLFITLRDRKLRNVTVVMFTGSEPRRSSGVWVQEWFDSGTELRVNDARMPSKATIDFSSGVSQAEREAAFSLNTDCLVRLWGCKGVHEILPTLQQLKTSQHP